MQAGLCEDVGVRQSGDDDIERFAEGWRGILCIRPAIKIPCNAEYGADIRREGVRRVAAGQSIPEYLLLEGARHARNSVGQKRLLAQGWKVLRNRVFLR